MVDIPLRQARGIGRSDGGVFDTFHHDLSLVLAAFQSREAPLVDLRHACQRANILTVLPREVLELLDLAAGQLQIHRQSFDPFVNRHAPLV
jgi:hypothetical protein